MLYEESIREGGRSRTRMLRILRASLLTGVSLHLPPQHSATLRTADKLPMGLPSIVISGIPSGVPLRGPPSQGYAAHTLFVRASLLRPCGPASVLRSTRLIGSLGAPSLLVASLLLSPVSLIPTSSIGIGGELNARSLLLSLRQGLGLSDLCGPVLRFTPLRYGHRDGLLEGLRPLLPTYITGGTPGAVAMQVAYGHCIAGSRALRCGWAPPLGPS